MTRRQATKPVSREAQGNYGLALGWLKRGRLREAIVAFRRALQLEPAYLDPYLELGKVLMHLRRWADLIDLCRQGLVHFIEVPELHKLMITAIEESHSLDDAYATYELHRVDDRCLAIEPQQVLCCLVVRNEASRLPSFFSHYRSLGVDRFLVIDNDSEDGSDRWLLNQKDVHLWHSPMSFRRANFGSSWFELLLRRHGIGNWVVTVDADEHLVYDGYRTRPLRSFCDDLERRQLEAASGILLDMYGDQPIRVTRLPAGADPLDACPFFDRDFFTQRDEMGGHYRNQTITFGGVRQRVFPAENDYLLSKIPLLRYRPRMVLTSGQHLTNLPAASIAHEEVCLLHFKFLDTFLPYAYQEAAREVHAMGAQQYKAYASRLAVDEDMTLFHPELSTRFEGVAQLQSLGIMSPEPAPQFAEFPAVERVTGAEPRPFWSVMITLYDRLHNLEPVVQGVIAQGCQDMQIELVHDGDDDNLRHDLARRLRAIAGDRASLYCPPSRLGHPHVFNICIERARGEWVHILHDDDRVEPGFYGTLREGILAHPEVGAAFTQHRIVASGTAEPVTWNSWVERETAGIIEDWLSRVAIECRVQFSAMTVKRAAYEAVGGFCDLARSAFDWEMWKRLAVRFPVWYAPQTLVTVGRDGTAESSRLMRNGEQVADSLATVEISRRYFPPAVADRLSNKARERLCLYALEIARQYLERGDSVAAVANLKAAAKGSTSSKVNRVLGQVLRDVDDEFCH